MEPFTGVIDRILEDDLRRPRKQRHTAKRIFERLRDEYGFDGGYTTVKDYARENRRQTREMFVPLSHAPGHAQCDFGEALVVIGGVERKAHCFVIDLPHGLDEYETRSWAGWYHHIAMCLLGGAFLLGLQQDWGKKMPRITRPQVYRVVREMLPREQFGPDQLLLWLEATQLRNERARRSHERRRSTRREGRMEPPP